MENKRKEPQATPELVKKISDNTYRLTIIFSVLVTLLCIGVMVSIAVAHTMHFFISELTQVNSNILPVLAIGVVVTWILHCEINNRRKRVCKYINMINKPVGNIYRPIEISKFRKVCELPIKTSPDAMYLVPDKEDPTYFELHVTEQGGVGTKRLPTIQDVKKLIKDEISKNN